MQKYLNPPRMANSGAMRIIWTYDSLLATTNIVATTLLSKVAARTRLTMNPQKPPPDSCFVTNTYLKPNVSAEHANSKQYRTYISRYFFR